MEWLILGAALFIGWLAWKSKASNEAHTGGLTEKIY